MPEELVPPDRTDELSACDLGGLCTPDVAIATVNRYVPESCRSVDDGEGRCTDVVVKRVAEQLDRLPQDVCGTSERCAPCYDPIDGSDTAACRQSCDPGPAEPPHLFDDCCERGAPPEGKCVPRAQVPADMADRLERDTCIGDRLCAPTEALSPGFRGPPCEGYAILLGGTYEGVCLSRCIHLDGVEATVVKQGTCDTLHLCVPCDGPDGPTHAPGCPGT
jgi:hypothetical protein